MNFFNKLNYFKKALFAFLIGSSFLMTVSSCNEEDIEPESQYEYSLYTSNLFTVTVDGDEGLDATFRNYSVEAESYSWEVYDEDEILVTSSTDEEFAYTFSDYGYYTVNLTVTDSDGGTETDSIEISVASVSFTYEVNTDTVSFTNESIAAASYEWDFGDGSEVSTEESPSYTYTAAGDYSVTLTAYDENGVKLGVYPDPSSDDYEEVIVSATVDTGEGNTGVEPGFDAVIINGDVNTYGGVDKSELGPWSVDPDSTLGDGSTSPYDFWSNSDLKNAIRAEATLSGSNEKPSYAATPSNTSAGHLRLDEGKDRLYQPVQIEEGVNYRLNFSIAKRNEATDYSAGTVYILNSEIASDADLATSTVASYDIVHTGAADTFVDYSFEFTADSFFTTAESGFSSSKIIDGSPSGASDADAQWIIVYFVPSSTIDDRLYVDDISIDSGVTIGGSDSEETVTADIAASILNGDFETFSFKNGVATDGTTTTIEDPENAPALLDNDQDNADAFSLTPGSTVKTDAGALEDLYTWYNSDLRDWIDTNVCDDNNNGGVTSSRNNGNWAIKMDEASRRLYQPIQDITVGVTYTISLYIRKEFSNELNIYILNNAIADETDLEGNSDAVYTTTNSDNSYSLHTFTFTASTDTAIFYAVPSFLDLADGGHTATSNCEYKDQEIIIDDISISTPGF